MVVPLALPLKLVCNVTRLWQNFAPPRKFYAYATASEHIKCGSRVVHKLINKTMQKEVRNSELGPKAIASPNMRVRRNFSGRGVAISTFPTLLPMQCKWTSIKRSTLSTPQRKWPSMLRQQSETARCWQQFFSFMLLTQYESAWLIGMSSYRQAALSASNSQVHRNVCYRNSGLLQM